MPAAAYADEPDTHRCEFIIILANCPGADPDWYWICTTAEGAEYYNYCDLY